MPTSQYLPFAIGVGANALSFTTYSTDPLVGTGHVPGVARAEMMNTTLRQLSVGVAGVAKFVIDNHPSGADMLDDGSMTNFATKLQAAITALIGTNAGTTQSLGPSGWVRLQNGLILQWQSCTTGAGNYSFPITFTTTVFVVCATNASSQGNAVDNSFAYPISLSQFYCSAKSSIDGVGESPDPYPSFLISLGV